MVQATRHSRSDNDNIFFTVKIVKVSKLQEFLQICTEEVKVSSFIFLDCLKAVEDSLFTQVHVYHAIFVKSSFRSRLA